MLQIPAAVIHRLEKKFLPNVVGVIAAMLLLIGHLVQSSSVLSFIGTLLTIVLVIILARGLTDRLSA